MSPTDEHPPAPDPAADESSPADSAGVLSSLPGTRPQRRSPKRSARATPATPADRPATHVEDPPQPGASPDAAHVDAAQGFEAEPLHGAVDPPTAAELLASVARGATDLTERAAGLAGRLARSLLDRVPRL